MPKDRPRTLRIGNVSMQANTTTDFTQGTIAVARNVATNLFVAKLASF